MKKIISITLIFVMLLTACGTVANPAPENRSGSRDYILVNIDEQQQIQNEEETIMTNQLTDYPEQPIGEKMRQLESEESPLLAQTAPADAKELYFSFDEDLKAAEEKYAYYRFEVSGIASKVKPDVHNNPSIELSDEVSGKCYVLCVFNPDEIYGKVSVGDHVVCRGNYLIASSLYGIVLKNSEVVVGE